MPYLTNKTDGTKRAISKIANIIQRYGTLLYTAGSKNIVTFPEDFLCQTWYRTQPLYRGCRDEKFDDDKLYRLLEDFAIQYEKLQSNQKCIPSLFQAVLF